jgi:hypothetical protein
MTMHKVRAAVLVAVLASGTPAWAQVTGGTVAVRDSSTGTLVPNIGDDTNDALRVNIVAGAGSGGTSQADNSAVTTITGAGALYDTTPPSITDGNVGLFRMTSTRVLMIDGSATTQPVSGTVTANAGSGTFTVGATDLDIRNLVFATDKVDASGSTLGANSGVDIGDVTVNNASGAAAVNIQDGGNSITVDGTVAATQSGTWTVQPGNTANTTAWLVKELRAASPTLSNVASSATSVTCLASNANRLGAVIYNDSLQPAFVKFGATASATSFTEKVEGAGTLEVPFGYTGVIDCIWASANGNARVTELAQ